MNNSMKPSFAVILPGKDMELDGFSQNLGVILDADNSM